MNPIIFLVIPYLYFFCKVVNKESEAISTPFDDNAVAVNRYHIIVIKLANQTMSLFWNKAKLPANDFGYLSLSCSIFRAIFTKSPLI